MRDFKPPVLLAIDVAIFTPMCGGVGLEGSYIVVDVLYDDAVKLSLKCNNFGVMLSNSHLPGLY